jgi:hypothetical protein
MSRGGGKDQASYLLSLPNMLRDYDNGKRDILTLPKELYLRNCRLAFLAPVEFGVSFRRREGFELRCLRRRKRNLRSFSSTAVLVGFFPVSWIATMLASALST